MRDIIDHLVSSAATLEELQSATRQLSEVAEVIREMPTGMHYRGYAEAANAGEAFPLTNGGPLDDGPERFAMFDHSPFIGLANPLSPPMILSHRDDRVVADVTFGRAYEGPPGCVHGGLVAAAFDELLGAAQSLSGTQGMTAHLEVDYRLPTPLGVPLRLTGWLDRREGRKIWARATMHAGDTLTAEAEGLFIAFDTERFQALLRARQENFERGS